MTMMRQTTRVRYLRMTPRKVRAVADVLRGMPVKEAEAQLVHQSRRAARPLLKLLRSAMANAAHNSKLNPDALLIESIQVDQGPMLKRYLPRARGSASPIQKKTSHVTVVLRAGSMVHPPRFTIVVPKKEKKLPEAEKRAKKERMPHEEASSVRHAKKSGFLRKIFSRKSGM